MNELIIDNSNAHTILESIRGFNLVVLYTLPDKSIKTEIATYTNSYSPQQAFPTIKAILLKAFMNHIIIEGSASIIPETYYTVQCPKCSHEAEIVDYVNYQNLKGYPHDIICRHCASNKDSQTHLENVIGICKLNLFQRSIKEAFNVRNI